MVHQKTKLYSVAMKLLVFTMLLGSLLPLALNTNQVHAQSKNATNTLLQSNYGLPSWWKDNNGNLVDCDKYNYKQATGNTTTAFVMATWRGIEACGPRPQDTGVLPDNYVTFPGSSSQEQEFECTELVKRYLKLAYGMNSLAASGGDLVSIYTAEPPNASYNGSTYGSNPFYNHKVTNGTAGLYPKEGDVISGSGHTAIVENVVIDYTKVGTADITIFEQNESSSGIRHLAMANWSIPSVDNWMTTTDITPIPGGIYNSSTPADGTNQIGSVNVSVHAVDNSGTGLNKVNITTSQEGSNTWTTIQTYTAPVNQTITTTDVSATVPISQVLNQLVSFDVYSNNGKSNLAPNGIRRFCPSGASCTPYNGTVGNIGGGSPQPGNGFTVYSGTNYGGSFETFTYSSDNQCISLDQMAGKQQSLQFTGSYAGKYNAVMYHDSGCGTYLARYFTGSSDLSQNLLTNQFSSMRLETIKDTSCNVDQTTANGVLLIRDGGFSLNGGCKLFTATDTTNQNDLGQITWNNVTGIKFLGTYVLHYQITLYKDANYGGQCGSFFTDQSWIVGTCANNFDSIKIAAYTPPAQAQNVATTATLDHANAQAVVDGNLATSWSGGNKSPLGFVWNTPQTIQNVTVFDSGPVTQNSTMNTVDIDFSDGTVLKNMDMSSAGMHCTNITIPAKTVSWVNIVPDDASSSAGFSEIQIWDTSGAAYSTNNCPNTYSLTPKTGNGPNPLTVPCIPGSTQVAFFTNVNYGGSCTVLNAGNYADSSSLGFAGGTLSSLTLGSNVSEVILYQNGQYGGGSKIVSTNNADLGTVNFSKLTSSAQIVAGNAAPTTVNLALNHPTFASSLEASYFPAYQATDGSLNSRWSSGYTDPQWIYVDLGGVYNVNRVRLYWSVAYSSNYQIQVSDDAVTWASIYSTTNRTGGVDDLTNLSGVGRYVRMFSTLHGTPNMSISPLEFEVYGTPYTETPNLALNQPTVASSLEASYFPAYQATDGNLNSRWSSAYPDPQWIYVDLGKDYNINRVRLFWSVAYSSNYQIQVSDDAINWATIFSTTNRNGGVDDLTNLSGVGRYVRMLSTLHGTPNLCVSPLEFEVYGTPYTETPNLALNQPTVASSLEASYFPAYQATDGNLNSRWSSLYTDPQWIYVDLGADHTINRVKLSWSVAYSSAYQIQVSDDAVNWISIYSTTTGSGNVADITNLSGTGRYVRMLSTQHGTPNLSISVLEFEVYGS